MSPSPKLVGCATWLMDLGDFVDDALPAARARAMRTHVQGCPGCQAVLSDYQKTLGLCRLLGQAGASPQTDSHPS